LNGWIAESKGHKFDCTKAIAPTTHEKARRVTIGSLTTGAYINSLNYNDGFILF
jgi:hypothetical protein